MTFVGGKVPRPNAETGLVSWNYRSWRDVFAARTNKPPNARPVNLATRRGIGPGRKPADFQGPRRAG
ncbi:hypothetical protein BaRGS_00030338 [Batillaria attramentaria]|uniref:Uncharacterized protein n=1 Tax=Batillaria attramentaria TaxID=370345 RepID=A0ABD0JU25_9CAEN